MSENVKFNWHTYQSRIPTKEDSDKSSQILFKSCSNINHKCSNYEHDCIYYWANINIIRNCPYCKWASFPK